MTVADKVDIRKLAHAYVALALAQDEARRYVKQQHSEQTALLPLLNTLEVTAELLEDILQHAMPDTSQSIQPAIISSNMLM